MGGNEWKVLWFTVLKDILLHLFFISSSFELQSEITWNTMIQLRWNILIMTTTIGVNVMVALCGHLPNVEIYEQYQAACSIVG